MIMKHEINVPEGCKVISVETTDKMVVVKFEKEEPEFKENDVITCVDGLYKWIAIFVEQNPQVASMKRVKEAKNAPKPFPEVQEEELPKTVLELQSELKKLQAQLNKAEIKAEAYDELINVAEAKFNIQIRKKAGAKQ